MVDFRGPDQPLNIYLAGELASAPDRDWRSDIVKSENLVADVTEAGMWPIYKKAVRRAHHYTGPYYNHPGEDELTVDEATSLRATALLQANMVFYYMGLSSDPTAMFELGFAVGAGIPTAICKPPNGHNPDREQFPIWLVLKGVDLVATHSKPAEAFDLAIPKVRGLVNDNPNARWAYMTENKWGSDCYYCGDETEKGLPFMWKKNEGRSYTAHIECFVKQAPARVVEASAKKEMLDTLIEVLREENAE